MALAMRPFRLAFLVLLATAATGGNIVVLGRTTDTSAPRHLDDSAPATTAPPTCSSSCACVCVVVHTREAAVPAAATATTKKTALLHALPLLAVPFLPPPLAALAVLASLTTPTRADDDTCRLRAHATCTVYRYLPLPDGTGAVDRSRPLDGVRPIACGQRLDLNLRRYCHVRTLEFYDRPEGGVAWRVLADHPPLADPDAVVAAGGDVCYVEMEHLLNRREGYYIRCPVRKCPRFPFLCFSDSPHRGGVVWDKYSNGTAIDAQA